MSAHIKIIIMIWTEKSEKCYVSICKSALNLRNPLIKAKLLQVVTFNI